MPKQLFAHFNKTGKNLTISNFMTPNFMWRRRRSCLFPPPIVLFALLICAIKEAVPEHAIVKIGSQIAKSFYHIGKRTFWHDGGDEGENENGKKMMTTLGANVNSNKIGHRPLPSDGGNMKKWEHKKGQKEGGKYFGNRSQQAKLKEEEKMNGKQIGDGQESESEEFFDPQFIPDEMPEMPLGHQTNSPHGMAEENIKKGKMGTQNGENHQQIMGGNEREKKEQNEKQIESVSKEFFSAEEGDKENEKGQEYVLHANWPHGTNLQTLPWHEKGKEFHHLLKGIGKGDGVDVKAAREWAEEGAKAKSGERGGMANMHGGGRRHKSVPNILEGKLEKNEIEKWKLEWKQRNNGEWKRTNIIGGNNHGGGGMAENGAGAELGRKAWDHAKWEKDEHNGNWQKEIGNKWEIKKKAKSEEMEGERGRRADGPIQWKKHKSEEKKATSSESMKGGITRPIKGEQNPHNSQQHEHRHPIKTMHHIGTEMIHGHQKNVVEKSEIHNGGNRANERGSTVKGQNGGMNGAKATVIRGGNGPNGQIGPNGRENGRNELGGGQLDGPSGRIERNGTGNGLGELEGNKKGDGKTTGGGNDRKENIKNENKHQIGRPFSSHMGDNIQRKGNKGNLKKGKWKPKLSDEEDEEMKRNVGRKIDAKMWENVERFGRGAGNRQIWAKENVAKLVGEKDNKVPDEHRHHGEEKHSIGEGNLLTKPTEMGKHQGNKENNEKGHKSGIHGKNGKIAEKLAIEKNYANKGEVEKDMNNAHKKHQRGQGHNNVNDGKPENHHKNGEGSGKNVMQGKEKMHNLATLDGEELENEPGSPRSVLNPWKSEESSTDSLSVEEKEKGGEESSKINRGSGGRDEGRREEEGQEEVDGKMESMVKEDKAKEKENDNGTKIEMGEKVVVSLDHQNIRNKKKNEKENVAIKVDEGKGKFVATVKEALMEKQNEKGGEKRREIADWDNLPGLIKHDKRLLKIDDKEEVEIVGFQERKPLEELMNFCPKTQFIRTYYKWTEITVLNIKPTIWADYKFTKEEAMQQLLPIVPMLFKAFEEKPPLQRKKPLRRANNPINNIREEERKKTLIQLVDVKPSEKMVRMSRRIINFITKNKGSNRRFDALKEYFEKFKEKDPWAQLSGKVDMDDLEDIFEDYSHPKQFLPTYQIPMEQYKKMEEEEIKEYKFEDQYFWFIARLEVKNKMYYHEMLAHKIYSSQIERIEQKMSNALLDDEKHRKFIKEIFFLALHLINLVNWKSADPRVHPIGTLDLRRLQEILKIWKLPKFYLAHFIVAHYKYSNKGDARKFSEFVETLKSVTEKLQSSRSFYDEFENIQSQIGKLEDEMASFENKADFEAILQRNREFTGKLKQIQIFIKWLGFKLSDGDKKRNKEVESAHTFLIDGFNLLMAAAQDMQQKGQFYDIEFEEAKRGMKDGLQTYEALKKNLDVFLIAKAEKEAEEEEAKHSAIAAIPSHIRSGAPPPPPPPKNGRGAHSAPFPPAPPPPPHANGKGPPRPPQPPPPPRPPAPPPPMKRQTASFPSASFHGSSAAAGPSASSPHGPSPLHSGPPQHDPPSFANVHKGEETRNAAQSPASEKEDEPPDGRIHLSKEKESAQMKERNKDNQYENLMKKLERKFNGNKNSSSEEAFSEEA